MYLCKHAVAPWRVASSRKKPRLLVYVYYSVYAGPPIIRWGRSCWCIITCISGILALFSFLVGNDRREWPCRLHRVYVSGTTDWCGKMYYLHVCVDTELSSEVAWYCDTTSRLTSLWVVYRVSSSDDSECMAPHGINRVDVRYVDMYTVE